MTITFEKAKELLAGCQRSELRDHAFGDREVYFTKDGVDVASGYSGHLDVELCITHNEEHTVFMGKEADELMKLGTVGNVERNDSTGPDEYQEGECMPGLTKEGVLDELVNR